MNGGRCGPLHDALGLVLRRQHVAPAMQSTQHRGMAVGTRSCFPTHPAAGEACSGFAVQRMPTIAGVLGCWGAGDARCVGGRRLGTHAAHAPWLRRLLGPGPGGASCSHPLGLWCGPGHGGAHLRQRTLGSAKRAGQAGGAAAPGAGGGGSRHAAQRAVPEAAGCRLCQRGPDRQSRRHPAGLKRGPVAGPCQSTSRLYVGEAFFDSCQRRQGQRQSVVSMKFCTP